MSSQEFAEWMAYDQIDPFGEWRADLRSAIIASILANVYRGNQPVRTIEDFMPQFGAAADQPQTWQQQLHIVEVLNAAFGGKDERHA